MRLWNPVNDKTQQHAVWYGMLLLALMLLSGCETFDTQDGFLGFDKEPEIQVPDRILPMWTDTVLHQPGKPGVRGFGGRLYFYTEDEKDPVKVDGTLTVYLFDGETLDPHAAAPLKKYVFTADQFAEHHSSTSLGDSYSIWVPWDQVGGPAQSFSLIVRFDGREGGTVLSSPTVKLLPGVSDLAKKPDSNGEIQQASYETAGKPNVSETTLERHGSTTSIPLPPSFQRRLANSTVPADTASAAQSHTNSKLVDVPQVTFPATNPAPAAEATEVPTSLPAHSGWSRSPARDGARFQRERAALRKAPHHGELPSGLPPTPRNGSPAQSVGNWTAPVASDPATP